MESSENALTMRCRNLRSDCPQWVESGRSIPMPAMGGMQTFLAFLASGLKLTRQPLDGVKRIIACSPSTIEKTRSVTLAPVALDGSIRPQIYIQVFSVFEPTICSFAERPSALSVGADCRLYYSALVGHPPRMRRGWNVRNGSKADISLAAERATAS